MKVGSRKRSSISSALERSDASNPASELANAVTLYVALGGGVEPAPTFVP